MKLIRTVAACLVFCVAFVFGTSFAFANHGGPHWYRGIEVPALMHGQVVPMSNNFTAVMQAAENMSANPAYAKSPAMADIRELMDDAYTLRAKSWYGWVPFSLTSDLNPYHLPTHASLATAREILVRLNTFKGAGAEDAHTLYSTVSEQMFTNGADMVTCAYSGMTFNTLESVDPDYGRPFQSRDLFVAMVAALSVLGAGISLAWGTRKDRRPTFVHQHRLVA